MKELIKKELENQNTTPIFIANPGCSLIGKIHDAAHELGKKSFILNTAVNRCDLFKENNDPAIRYAAEHPEENVLLVLNNFEQAPIEYGKALVEMCEKRKINKEKLPDNLQLAIIWNGRKETLQENILERLKPVEIG